MIWIVITIFFLHELIRWLTKGNVPVVVVNFRNELQSYFLDHEFQLSSRQKIIYGYQRLHIKQIFFQN